VAFDSVKIINNGCSSIEYNWKQIEIPKSFEFHCEDLKDYFHLHYTKNVIRPGEQSNFAFSFYSDIPGEFHSKYELITDPP